ncbi:hypothetical protein CNBG_3874 [Cryptococcus deuterogattii R265]|uniref:uncharacterized protein n=1 Tax=Cryptococcus deuterogattii (strain R265) TaxID=294750 RepID=UPI001937D8E5|nr:hypothetical protein CNBG_3874 [Cryptococcus deuterogattii R265]
MFAKAAVIALASASIVVAAPVNCARSKPSTYAEGYLEDYDTYHARYLALSCNTQHNTTFFDDCCHPLLANETLADNRASYCTPNSTAVASINATMAEGAAATASATASADVEAESQYNNASSSDATASVTASSEATASETASALNNVAEIAQQSASATSSSEEQPTSASSSASEESAASTSSSSASTSSSTASSQVYTGGYATFYSQDGVAGACGTMHSDSDYVIAIDSNGWWQDYESNDNSPYCGKQITLTNTNNGKSVTATVADVCPTCETNNSLDLSIGAFNQIATEEEGMVPITWYFVN